MRTIAGKFVHAVDDNNNSIIILMEDSKKKPIAFKTEGKLSFDEPITNNQLNVHEPLLINPFKLIRRCKQIPKVGSFTGLTSEGMFEPFFVSFTSNILPGQWKLYTMPNKKLFFTRLK